MLKQIFDGFGNDVTSEFNGIIVDLQNRIVELEREIAELKAQLEKYEYETTAPVYTRKRKKKE